MTTIMAEERFRESARKRAMTRSITSMIQTAEDCVTGAGSLKIISERLPRGSHDAQMIRDPKTGQIDYSQQDEEAEKVMARLLYRKLSQAVQEPGDIAYAIVVNTDSKRRPEYLIPKMVHEVRGWALHPEEEGGFSTRRLSPGEVEDFCPGHHHVREDLDEELKRLSSGEDQEPAETFEEFMTEEMYDSFDEGARRLTQAEKLLLLAAELLLLRRQKEELDGPQHMPEDEVLYL